MRTPRDDEAIAALAKELAELYLKTNGFERSRGEFDNTIVSIVEHAVAYAFRIGYRTRVGEEGAEEVIVA